MTAYCLTCADRVPQPHMYCNACLDQFGGSRSASGRLLLFALGRWARGLPLASDADRRAVARAYDRVGQRLRQETEASRD